MTIRLLKWWRDQQAWSCALTRPSDYVIELIAIYAYQQCGKLTQCRRGRGDGAQAAVVCVAFVLV